MAVEHPGLWLIGDPGWHEERVAADDRQSRSQMRSHVMILVDFLKKQGFNLCVARKIKPLWKKVLVLTQKTIRLPFCFLH